ncbi:hypothetical protein SCHPADRAFT_898187 [Schizopora paradoxa]|uniref:Uncharacterized protein n=1 Tax=Schizopora paradoxa TaxID=27342 RepID=A0A0H2S751_9AGAM|nr:hypothetical protein SCHPADRAFT_898187 [Schizopora paradoxa]
MSSNTSTSTSNGTVQSDTLTINGKGLPSAAELEVLASFLRADVPDTENADVNLEEFMRRLDGVDDAAIEIEGRLDVLLEQLDGMVEGLEASHACSQRVEDVSSKEPPPENSSKKDNGTQSQ